MGILNGEFKYMILVKDIVRGMSWVGDFAW